MLENRLRRLRVRVDDALGVGERIEQEVRLDLRLQEGKLRLRLGLQRLGRTAALALQVGAEGFRAPVEDKEDICSIDISESRVLRGGSFFGVASNVRSANRNNAGPAARTLSYGFRPARTYR